MFAIFTFEAPEGCFSSFLFMFSFLYPFVVVVFVVFTVTL